MSACRDWCAVKSVVVDVNTIGDVVAELSKDEDEIAQESLQVRT